MTTNTIRIHAAETAREYVESQSNVRHARISQDDDEIHAFGVMPNTHQTGWYFAGYVDDLVEQAAAERSKP